MRCHAVPEGRSLPYRSSAEGGTVLTEGQPQVAGATCDAQPSREFQSGGGEGLVGAGPIGVRATRW